MKRRAASGAPADPLRRGQQLNPRFVNLLAGNDRWPLAQQVDFLGRRTSWPPGLV
jgi:hypothetical protein